MQGVGRSSLKMSFSSRRARRLSRSAKRFVVVAAVERVTPATIAVEAATKVRRERMPGLDIGFSCSVIQNHTPNRSVVGQFSKCKLDGQVPPVTFHNAVGASVRAGEYRPARELRRPPGLSV